MEIISGGNNWKVVIRRQAEGITILYAQTCDKQAVLPETLFDLPVVELAHHAMTPGRAAPEGECVQITCGPASGEWDNSCLQELYLPKTVKRVGDYAFYKCAALKTLHFSDGLLHWGGGALMNCRALDTFHLQCSGQEGEILAYLADELSRELDITLSWPERGSARVILPEYLEIYEENVPHHQFDFHIQGAGYAYHHCFYQRKFSLRDYDDLWKGYLGMEYEPDCAMRLAWWRLRHPVDLTEKAAAGYWSYLSGRKKAVAQWRIEERDTAGLRYLLKKAEWERQELSELSALARERNETELLAVLLEEQHRRFPIGRNKSFDL